MKTKFFILVVLLGTMLFIGCNSGEPDVEPQPYVLIVKFKDVSYKNHLIVTDYSEGADGTLILMRGNWCERTQYLTFSENDVDGSKINGEDWNFSFPERIRDPFWALPDGWYLIDWAWHGLSTPYPYDGNTILTDVTFDNYRTYGPSEFDKSVPHVYKGRKNIFESRMINIADLMGYSYPDGNYPSYKMRSYNKTSGADSIKVFANQYFYHRVLACTKPVSNFENCLCERADELDGYWADLQSQITILINNGDLDNLEKFAVNKLY